MRFLREFHANWGTRDVIAKRRVARFLKNGVWTGCKVGAGEDGKTGKKQISLRGMTERKTRAKAKTTTTTAEADSLRE
jgi:hypothetical protein